MAITEDKSTVTKSGSVKGKNPNAVIPQASPAQLDPTQTEGATPATEPEAGPVQTEAGIAPETESAAEEPSTDTTPATDVVDGAGVPTLETQPKLEEKIGDGAEKDEEETQGHQTSVALSLNDNVMIDVRQSANDNGRYIASIEKLLIILFQNELAKVKVNEQHVDPILDLIRSVPGVRGYPAITEAIRVRAARIFKMANEPTNA